MEDSFATRSSHFLSSVCPEFTRARWVGGVNVLIVQTSLNRGGGLRHNLSLAYNPVNTADSPSPGEFPPDRAEVATRMSRKTVL